MYLCSIVSNISFTRHPCCSSLLQHAFTNPLFASLARWNCIPYTSCLFVHHRASSCPSQFSFHRPRHLELPQRHLGGESRRQIQWSDPGHPPQHPPNLPSRPDTKAPRRSRPHLLLLPWLLRHRRTPTRRLLRCNQQLFHSHPPDRPRLLLRMESQHDRLLTRLHLPRRQQSR